MLSEQSNGDIDSPQQNNKDNNSQKDEDNGKVEKRD